VTISTFKDITANGDVYENRHYLWDTLSIYTAILIRGRLNEFLTESLLSMSRVNFWLSDIRACGFLIQPAKISKKIYTVFIKLL
jgi:hypothetical protein